MMTAAALVGALLAIQSSSWPIGVEREVDEGTYMQVVAAEHGWRVWRIETRSGSQCRAVKSARGRSHPVPVGVGSMMEGGTPYLSVDWSPRYGASYSWGAAHYGDVRVEYRSPGARFWEDGRSSAFDPVSLDGRVLELHVESWEYPALGLGHVEERAELDLSGASWARAELEACGGSPASTGPSIPLASTRLALITDPQWDAPPRLAFPERASSRGLTSGSVTLTCAVTENGSPQNCEVIDETPANAGFGQAALRSVSSGRFSSNTVDRLAPGGRARFALHFNAATP